VGTIGFLPFELENLRDRLRKMSDAELERFGKAAREMSKPEANFGKPSEVYVTQLREAREEWRRRHPREPKPE
jgi:hypothetical protein